MSRTWSRRASALVVSGALAGVLSGCGPSDLGVTGLTVDEQGSAVIVLAVCRDHIMRGGILDSGTDGKAYRSAGSWTASVPLGRGLTMLPVAAPPPGWVQDDPAQPLVAGVQYEAWGGTTDHNGATISVSFGTADLQELAPGTVRYRTYYEKPDGSVVEGAASVPVGDFLKIACS